MELKNALANIKLLDNPDLLKAVEEMIQPLLFKGYFGDSFTRIVSGLQYHLSGYLDTKELAELASINSDDLVLDECCFIGGPALQLAIEYGCKVIGVDLDENAIMAANRIAELVDLKTNLSFEVANAVSLPFPENHFTVVWNQCSFEHDEEWIDELDRVLKPAGRIALTMQIPKNNRDQNNPFGRWSLADLEDLLISKKYEIIDKADITDRDIKHGWKKLIDKLIKNKELYIKSFGKKWVEEAANDFNKCIEEMEIGKYGNGRIAAIKSD